MNVGQKAAPVNTQGTSTSRDANLKCHRARPARVVWTAELWDKRRIARDEWCGQGTNAVMSRPAIKKY